MKRVFLVGYMGAGKTTVGKELAKLAGLSFIDLDYYIEGRYHKAVSQIFAERGEEAFREIERNMLHEVAEFEDVLISTGGGAPCFFDNMEFMNASDGLLEGVSRGAGEASGVVQTYPSGVERTFRGGTEGVYRRESGEKESVLYEGVHNV